MFTSTEAYELVKNTRTTVQTAKNMVLDAEAVHAQAVDLWIAALHLEEQREKANANPK